MNRAAPNVPRIDVSIVIPAFNEASRLPAFLTQVIAYCNRSKRTYEIIIVDDGSRDGTAQLSESHKGRFPLLQVIRNRRNRGKGYAVKRGLLRARGEICLFMDADGSVQPDEIEKNLPYLTEKGYDIFVGSRVLKGKGQVLKVRWHRKLIGSIFSFFVGRFLFKQIQDTQCGFKVFRSETVRPLFSRSYLRGFGFDIEILYLARKMGYRVKEGPVSWRHVSGSKVNLLTDSLRMFLNILQVRNWHCTPINPFSKYLGPQEYTYMFRMEERHWWFVSHRRLSTRLMQLLGYHRPRILDVGCGTGRNLLGFQGLGEAIGVDISDKALAFCRQRGIRNVVQSSAEQLPLGSGTFDIVACLEVLEHVSDPVTTLQEVRRVLKPDGKVVITVPAFRFLWSQHDDALCHLRRYERGPLCIDLREAGFKVEKVGFFFFASFFVVAPIRVARRFLTGKSKYPHSDTTTLPPKLLNALLIWVFKFELFLAEKIALPFGTTLFAIGSNTLPTRRPKGRQVTKSLASG